MPQSEIMYRRMYIIFAAGLCMVLAIIMYFFSLNEAREPTVLFVTSSEAREKINEHQDAFILDVRTSGEFYAGRIPGAVNIPYQQIESNQGLLPRNKHALIFVYCRTGSRATDATAELLRLGYTNIVIFPGMASWEYETVSG